MGWTAPRTWVAGETVTAAMLNQHLRDNLLALTGLVVKASDESVTSSAVLQDDNELTFSVGATGTYLIDLYLIVLSAANAAGDFNLSFTFPTGSGGTLFAFAQGVDDALPSSNFADLKARGLAITSGTTLVGPFGASTTNTFLWVRCVLVANATGTFKLQWCQNVSNANATTVKAGSHMSWKQVA